MATYISLNGERYEVDETVGITEKQTSPWLAQLGSSNVEFGNYSPADVEEYRDFRGGIGKESEEKRAQRLWWSESIETTKEGYVSLGPLVTTAGAFNATPLKILDFASETYAFATSQSSYWTGTAWATADPSPLATPTDTIVFRDSTNDYLFACNGTAVRYCATGHGGSVDWGTLASAAGSKYFCSFDKRLIGVDSTGTTIYYSPRDNCDGTWVSFNISGDYTAATDLFDGKLLSTGEPVIYMLTDTGLFVIDFYTQTCYKMEVRFPPTSNAMVGMYWNGAVYVATGAGIIRITSSTVEPWGPDEDDGLPASYQGLVYDIIGISHWVIIAVSGGTYSSILKRHESSGGWHQGQEQPANSMGVSLL